MYIFENILQTFCPVEYVSTFAGKTNFLAEEK